MARAQQWALAVIGGGFTALAIQTATTESSTMAWLNDRLWYAVLAAAIVCWVGFIALHCRDRITRALDGVRREIRDRHDGDHIEALAAQYGADISEPAHRRAQIRRVH